MMFGKFWGLTVKYFTRKSQSFAVATAAYVRVRLLNTSQERHFSKNSQILSLNFHFY